jgi:hypothetical protein
MQTESDWGLRKFVDFEAVGPLVPATLGSEDCFRMLSLQVYASRPFATR